MTEQEILKSQKLKKTFCKDNNIPITVYAEPYFMERIHSFSPAYDCLNKWDDFVDMLKDFADEQFFFQYRDSVENQVISDITSSVEFQTFNLTTIYKVGDKSLITYPDGTEEKYPIKQLHQRNVYNPENDGKHFISIDMRQANFNALWIFDKRIFGCNTWEAFMRKYTRHNSLINSEHIRQVIFGKCDPKKIFGYERLLMERLAYSIEQVFGEENPIEFYCINGDEIIIRDDEYTVDMNKINSCIENSPVKGSVRVESFSVHMMVDGMGYIKAKKFMQYSYKCVNSDILPQVVRFYNHDPIRDTDLVFCHNGKLAKFLEPIKRPW